MSKPHLPQIKNRLVRETQKEKSNNDKQPRGEKLNNSEGREGFRETLIHPSLPSKALQDESKPRRVSEAGV